MPSSCNYVLVSGREREGENVRNREREGEEREMRSVLNAVHRTGSSPPGEIMSLSGSKAERRVKDPTITRVYDNDSRSQGDFPLKRTPPLPLGSVDGWWKRIGNAPGVD